MKSDEYRYSFRLLIFFLQLMVTPTGRRHGIPIYYEASIMPCNASKYPNNFEYLFQNDKLYLRFLH